MKIHIIRQPATDDQIREMLEVYGTFIKLAVDVERGIVAGGGKYHADGEKLLLEEGSHQQNIWGADWWPDTRTVEFEAVINIRPRDGNRSPAIFSRVLRERVEAIARRLLEVQPT